MLRRLIVSVRSEGGQHVVVKTADLQDLLALGSVERLDALAKSAQYGFPVPCQRSLQQGLPGAMMVVAQSGLIGIGPVRMLNLKAASIAVQLDRVELVFNASQGFALVLI